MENNQENIPPVVQTEPSKTIAKNWFLNHKPLWLVFGIVITIGIFAYFIVVKNPCFSENYLGAELGPECANSLIPENLPSQYDEALTRKVYRDESNGFEFKYPSDWNLRNQSQDVFKVDLIFQSKTNDTIEFILVDDEFTPCEEDCVNNYNQNISGNDWIIYNLQYGGEKGKAAVLKKNNSRFVFSSSKSTNFNSSIFDEFLYTFKFTKLKPTDTRAGNLKPDSFEWCMANGGDNRTPNYNAPKVCILNNKVYEENCVSNAKYFVIESNLTDSVGSNHLVKFKTNENQNFDCKYVIEKGDFEIKNEWAEYTLALENNFLILDSGTGPDPRGLIVYDLNLRKKVYEDSYSQPINIQNNIVDYWTGTTKPVTEQNCPEFKKWEEGGLGSAIDAHVSLNLLTLVEKELGEYRCSPRQ